MLEDTVHLGHNFRIHDVTTSHNLRLHIPQARFILKWMRPVLYNRTSCNDGHVLDPCYPGQ